MNDAAWGELAARTRMMYRHWAAAISEGICPVHYTRLDPVCTTDGRIAGFCTASRGWWWYNQADQQAGWSAVILAPVAAGGVLLPEWLAA